MKEEIYAVDVGFSFGSLIVELHEPETNYGKAFDQAVLIIEDELGRAKDRAYSTREVAKARGENNE